ncbi:ATP-binding protein [Paenibacillus hodogayensis]|uniref:ATP-binding protein n=1 Tax=Paenibacillus hodogayensis TaxID=279208 RepID=A0ABV5W5D4_9BACL
MLTHKLVLVGGGRELERLRQFLTEAGEANGLDERMLYRLNLVCDELVTNIVSYGYGDGAAAEPRIEVDVLPAPDGVELVIADNGIAFNPLLHPQPDLLAEVEERGIGGLGIHFVLKLTTAASYERQDERNVLRLTMNRRHAEEEYGDEYRA